MDKSELLHQLYIDRTATPSAPRMGLWVLLSLILVVVGGSAWFMLFHGKTYNVHTAIAQPFTTAQGNTSVLDATGYVTARRQATVSAKVTGRVAEVLIEEGQYVKEGQVLARLDNTDANAQFALAQSQSAAAQAQLADVEIQLSQAGRDQKRQEALLAHKLISTQAVENARTQVASLKARLATQKRQVEVTQRNVAVAQVGLDNTVVSAPFSGVITVKAAQQGEIISPMSAGGGFTRTGIGTVVDMDSLEIEVEVNEAYIGRVQANQPVAIALNAYSDWKIPGKVITIIPTADRSKATVKVRISIDEKDSRIVPDMGAKVAFMEEQKTSANTNTLSGVLIPAKAIYVQGDINQVFVVADERAQLRKVTLGQSFADSRQVVEGLKAGERVVLEPPLELKDRDRISIEQ